MTESGRICAKKSEGSEWVQEAVVLSMYYDFYGELLSEHHRRIFEDYVWNDMSLGEIAEELSLTRQGVYDIVKRCSKKLYDYEDKLKLVQRFLTIKEKVNRIQTTAIEMEAEGLAGEQSERIVTLCKEVLQEL